MAIPRNSRLGIFLNCWRCAFFNSAASCTSARENTFTYDEFVSGSIIYTYVENNPLSYIDPFGLDLTPAQQQAVISAAQDWTNSKVPYKYGGNTKKGADCSGSVSSLYNQAGINIGRLTSSSFARSPLFKPVPPGEKLQPGDVGVYIPPNSSYPHVDIYGGSNNTGMPSADVWSAFNSKPGAPPFGPANSSWFGTPAWYRYNP